MFTRLIKKQYPRRLWALAGEAGSGKSTFAAQLKPALLAIDADHRFDEVVGLVAGEVFSLSEQPIDHISADRIALRLRENMSGANVSTIIVDSLTAIIKPLMIRAVRDNDAGANKNRVTAFKDKATAMSLIQDAVSAWGTDVLWIWHLQSARNEKAAEVIRATLSDLERTRLQRSLNAELHVVIDAKGKRGLKVAWLRNQAARSGVILWDESGRWQDMPAKIEAAIYDPKVTPAAKPNPQPAGAPSETPATGAIVQSPLIASEPAQPDAADLPPRVTDGPDYCRLHLCSMQLTSAQVYYHVTPAGLCNGTVMIDADTPDSCKLHIVKMSEMAASGIPFHRLKDADGHTLAYCDGVTIKPNGKK